MKKLITVFSIFLLLTSCNQVKIAYVDVEEVLKEYQGSKDAEEEMKTKSGKISGELDQMAMSFQQKVQDYQKNSKSLSSDAKQKKEQELMQEQQQIQQRQQMVQQQVQAEGLKMLDKINDDIDSFLEEYAKSKGYTYILGTSQQTKSVLYGDNSLDITSDIVEALNENYEPETEEEKTEE